MNGVLCVFVELLFCASSQMLLVTFYVLLQIECSSVSDYSEKIIKANHLDNSKAFENVFMFKNVKAKLLFLIAARPDATFHIVKCQYMDFPPLWKRSDH